MKKIESLSGIRKKILGLYTKGFSSKDILKMIEENSDFKVSESTVKNIIKEFKTKTTQVIVQDDNMRTLVKENLENIIKCANDNLQILENIRAKVLKKLDDSETEKDDRLLLSYLREISASIRTQNDSIRTLNSLLESMKDTTKETEVTSIADISKTVSILKDLEKDGLIKILPAYFNSNLYKGQEIVEQKHNEQEEQEEQNQIFN